MTDVAVMGVDENRFGHSSTPIIKTSVHNAHRVIGQGKPLAALTVFLFYLFRMTFVLIFYYPLYRSRFRNNI